jgi:hypothetical protein
MKANKEHRGKLKKNASKTKHKDVGVKRFFTMY